jgi:hypothetical protein
MDVKLLIPATLFPNNLAVGGFLTPTPYLLPNGLTRIFGGARDSNGRSRIMWVDLDPITLEVTKVAKEPILDLGVPGTFDSNGMILGDIKNDKKSGLVLLTYVGFSNYPTVKFRAYSGLAVSKDDGESFQKVSSEPMISKEEFKLKTSIVAIHNMEFNESGIKLLAAIGSGWEIIAGNPYPKYEVWSFSGLDLDSLSLSNGPIFSNPENVYRLGRPRSYTLDSGEEIVIATGGKVDGDYRPYFFKNEGGTGYRRIEMDYPVKPGISRHATIQAAYPVHISSRDGNVALFNGNFMGKAGVLSVPVAGFK